MIILLKVILAIIAINRFSLAISYFSGKMDPAVNKMLLDKIPIFIPKDEGEKIMKTIFTITYIIVGLVSLFLIYAIFFII